MTSWERIEEVLNGALERPAAERAAFLESECCDDDALRREVGSLLDAHEQPGALDRLAPHVTPLASLLREAESPACGQLVGRYRIVERIGGGGMGIVYRAQDTEDGADVALKLMQPRFVEDATAVRRFRLEASMVAGLDHPNVCAVRDVGECEGHVYLAMPLYSGETLRQEIARGPLAVARAVDIAIQVSRGLEKAHAQGIVHRDIKPSNVFITTDGVALLLDFGIAKLAGVTLTASMAGPLGTVSYMSPEQLRGDRVDVRTDVWSLGVVMYEMLAGQRPFGRQAVGAVVNAIVHSDPESLTKHRPDVPEALARVVAKALAKLPDERFASAQQFGSELAAAMEGWSDSAARV